MCPLVAEVSDEGEVLSLRPDRDHPVSRGFACHKGLYYLDVHNDPDRLNTPLKRLNPRPEKPGRFEPVGWDEAFRDIGERLRGLRDRYGPDAIAVYAGNPIAFNSKAFGSAYSLALRLGSKRAFNAATQDLSNKRAATLAVFGSLIAPVPDFYRTNYHLCLGTNPKVSKWTLVSTHRPLHVLEDVVARGGKVVFVNPRRIESVGPTTGDLLQIKPDTDVYFLAAVLQHVDELGGFRDDVIARHGKNIEGLRAFIRRYPADRVANVTGLAPEQIRQVAQEFMAADGASTHMSTGINQTRQGTLAAWLLHMLTFVTGNLGRDGGEYYARGYVSSASHMAYKAEPAFESELGELRHVAGAIPGNLLADFIELKENPVRALIVLSGNPLLSIGGEERLRKAFSKLEFMVAVDIYRNATGELADYVLPAADWLERPDVNAVSNGMQLIPYVQFSDAVVEPRFDRRDDWWILSRLEQELGLPSPLDTNTQDPLKLDEAKLAGAGLSIDQLRAMPHHTALLPQPPRDTFFEEVVRTPDRKVDCCPESFAEAIERCEAIFRELEAEDPGQLKLISLRTLHMHNGALMNMKSLKRGRHAENALHMHPADAAARGLGEGDEVAVWNANGRVVTRTLLDDTLRPGVVALTHGYGHVDSPGVSLANAAPGVNVNRLLPTGPGSYEPLSNMSHMTGVAVEVGPATGR
jgi:anaerobic selenocysteine-containing dehydrogenase